MKRKTWLGWPVGLPFVPAVAVLILGAGAAVRAQGEQGRPGVGTIPADAAVLEISLPAGASVSIDGVLQGTRRRVEFRPFPAGTLGRYEVKARYPDGAEESRPVLLRRGWHVRLALGQRDAARPELVPQTGHSDGVGMVAFSPDGKLVLTRSSNQGALLWEVPTGRRLRSFPGSRLMEEGPMGFSPDGRRVLIADRDPDFHGPTLLWDVASGEKIRAFKWHSKGINAIAYSPDGRRVLTGSSDKTAVVWDAETGREIFTLEGHAESVAVVAFSRDGHRILTGSRDKTAILWDAETGAKLCVFEGHTDEIYGVALRPDGRRVLTGSRDKTAILWDAETGRKVQALGHRQVVESVAFSPDGSEAMTGTPDHTIIHWDSETGRRLRAIGSDMPWLANGRPAQRRGLIDFSLDGRRVLTGYDDHSATIWDAQTHTKICDLRGRMDRVMTAAFAPDGRRFQTGLYDGTAVLWNAETGGKPLVLKGRVAIFPLATLALRMVGMPIDLNFSIRREFSDDKMAFSPDGRRIVTGTDGGSAILWNATTGEQIRILKGHHGRITHLAFSPDGRRIAAGGSGYGRQSLPVVWEAETGRLLCTLEVGSCPNDIAFSHDGRELIVCEDHYTWTWDIDTNRSRRSFGDRGSSLPGVYPVISPDARRVLSNPESLAPGGTKLNLWDVARGERLATMSTAPNTIGAMVFSPDGHQLLTYTDDSFVLWEVEPWRQVRVYKRAPYEVSTMRFRPDGRIVMTCSPWDGTIRFWDIATGDELAQVVSIDDGEDWLVTTPEGLFDGSEGGRQKVAFRVGGGLNVVPVDRFFQDFYHPGLLAELFRGERPRPEVDFARSRPPLIRIVSPEAGGTVEADSVEVEVEVEDQGGGIRGPQLFQNGVRVLAPGATERRGKVLKRGFTVGLVEGKNLIEVRDACGDGSQESDPAGLTLRYEKPLQKGDLYVLAVGINHYAQESMDLKFAAADARAIAAVFRQRGEALYRKTIVTELVDARATKAAIRGALKEIARTAGPGDTLIVFLAGHGTMVGQRFYFIPHDFRTDPGAPQAESVQRLGLPADVLADDLSAVRALRRLLVLDACQSGGALASGRSRDPFAMRGAIERIARSQGLFTIAASVAGDEAHEVPELGHGVLSYALLAGLGAADQGPLKGESMPRGNTEGVADVFGWFSYAAGQLPRLTKRYLGREQDAVMKTEGVSFPVLPVEER